MSEHAAHGQGLGAARLLESIEIAAWHELYTAASPEVASALGLKVASIDGALALAASGRESLLHNRVIGLGVFEPASTNTLDRVRDHFAGIPAHAVNLTPLAEPAALDDALRARGYATYFHHVKWVRGAEPAAPAPTRLRIDRVHEHQALLYGALAARISADGLPAHAAWTAGHVQLPRWTHFLAWDGETPVACAALHMSGDGAWLGGASTLESHRGQGAQSALLAARIDAAVAAGAKVLTLETGPNWPELDPVSYRNVARAGFRVAYERPSWIWPVPA